MLAVHVSFVVVISREAFTSSFAIIAAPRKVPASDQLAGSRMILSVVAVEVFLAQIALACAIEHHAWIWLGSGTSLQSASVNVRVCEKR